MYNNSKISYNFLCLLVILLAVTSYSQKKNILEVKINPNKTFQTVHNFGASDAWSTQFVGKFWPEDTKNNIAKLLFSTSNKKDGSPEGIGLTAWRFNIGAGSAEQNDDSKIKDEWRRTESFIGKNDSYNWNKQAGQLWFLKTAKKYGVKSFVAFVNSPPVYFTKNGKAWSGDGISSNLKENNYKKYADFLSNVVKGVKTKTDVIFNYVSPFNEPQWEWKCCGQEGSPWNNNEMFKAIKEINTSFKQNNITTKIEITEAGEIDFLYPSKKGLKKGNQISYFFNKDSKGYVGNLNSIAKKIAGHSYFTTWNSNTLINTRKLIHKEIKKINPALEYWMSEYCILEDNELIKGNVRDLSIKPALYMAKVIHSDLVFANASAWHWWLAISPYNYKDGLVYIDNNKFGGNYYESKMLWALGHYSRFIKPGMKRISISRIDNKPATETINTILQSAYSSNNEIVIIFVNQLNKTKSIKLLGIPKGYNTIESYQTTNDLNMNLKKMKNLNINQTITLPKKSLMTCILSLKK